MQPAKGAIAVFLRPGDYFVGGAGYQVRTLLGSCVSVVLWHPRSRVGAISHALLPRRPCGAGEPEGRYCEEAVGLMMRELIRAGVNPRECVAKLFGGGHMFEGVHGESCLMDIGRENGECARQYVLDSGICIVSENLFGAGHRELIFDIATGDVWVRQVELSPASAPAP